MTSRENSVNKRELQAATWMATLALAAPWAPVAQAQGATTLAIEIDAAQPQAALRSLTGVNKPPTFSNQTSSQQYDGSQLYKGFGVSEIRMHDSGGDLCTVYKAATKVNLSTSPATTLSSCTAAATGGNPHVRWTPTSSADADLNNPDNYDFIQLDEAIRNAQAVGARIYLGLAQRYNGPNDTDDPVAWAKVATNIYKHVIGQFKPTPGISADPSHVEVHNEPDGGFWRGSKSAFFQLYSEITTRVRAAASAAGRQVVIGGPGFTQNVITNSQNTSNPANGFVAGVGGAGMLDFYSVHAYDKCDQASLANAAQFLRGARALADAQGASGKPLQITEWNIGLGQQCGNDIYATQRMQSYASGLLTLMQDPAQNVTSAHFYAGVTVMSLFDFTTVAGKVRVNPSAWAFWAHAKLAGATGVRTQVCPANGSCVAGHAAESQALQALAGESGGKYTVVVTNDGASSQAYTLRLKGMGSRGTASALVRNPPQGSIDLAVSGNPAAPSATTMSQLWPRASAEQKTRLSVSGGQTELSLTVPARSVQVVEWFPGQAYPPVSSTQMDCLFAWGETQFPQLLAPSGQTSRTAAPYTYRYYPTTNTYIGVSAQDQRLYYLPASAASTPADLGPAIDSVLTAACQ